MQTPAATALAIAAFLWIVTSEIALNKALG